ncbi:type III pantothenate kinase [Dongia soli]|uniref:Type III pantothenate kinase n=1 Tax=Dongia soli TaxID=600628 RepID=A0ABU5E9J5_9PROT|nr:type III pantothenate kinase [Dongia soli]MDY0883021.1 type III pantothenate kinase [Dongia soli]
MLLAVDCGNTNIVFALYDGETQRGAWRISTDHRRTADEYGVWLTQLMELQGLAPEAVTGAIIASVVPDVIFELKTLIRHYFSCDPLLIGQNGIKLTIPVRLDRPEEVGADRLVNAVAAHHLYTGPLIVIDFGTATTFDVVDADGGYIGGVICPGINLSLEALYMAASKLPGIAITRPQHVIGRSTVPAMQSGIFWGYIGLIEGLVWRIRDEFGTPMKVIGTGGLAPLFKEATSAIEILDGDLTLRGLAMIYAANSKS